MSETATPLNIEQALSGTRSFKDVSSETVSRLISVAKTRALPGGSTLFRPGDAYRHLIYILVDGNLIMHRPSGRQDTVLPGDFVGLANYLDNHSYTTKTVATSHSLILEVDETEMKLLEQECPDLFNAFNRVIAHKLRERSPDRSISTGILAQPVTRVMKSPVASCDAETSLCEAFLAMQERMIGSLVVTGEAGRLKGVVTYAGLTEALLIKQAGARDPVIDYISSTPRAIDPDTPIWEAEEIQRRHNAKYLVVVDNLKPIGVLSQTDILEALISRPSTLSKRLRHAASIKELAGLARQLVDTASDAQETNHRPSAAVRLLSDTHLIIQKRVVELTLNWMETKGYGTPPAGFAMLIMGSGGRMEMLLNPDQDNGIIIEDTKESERKSVEIWFERFCKRINKNLDRVGYILCPGEIMASNPMYRKSLKAWKKQISNIVDKPTEKAARWANVVFDFDTLYGDDTLTEALRRHVLSELEKNPRLLKLMADHDAEGKAAIGFFNQLVTTKGDAGEHVDIKRNGLRIIADAARIFSLQNGIAVQNTVDRLEALVRVGKLSDDFKNSVQEAFEELLDLLLSHQIGQVRSGQELNKLIDPETLSRQSRSTLRMAMRAVKRFQEKLQDDYATDIF